MKIKNQRNRYKISKETANDTHHHYLEKLGLENAYNHWRSSLALAKGCGKKMADLYTDDAILIPTFLPKILFQKDSGIENYFSNLTKFSNLCCQTNQLITRLENTVGINSGMYTFSYTDSKDQEIIIPARFTFIYKKINNHWLVFEQHSSTLPVIP